MTAPLPGAIALITLGVADLARATRFYEALGFALALSSRDANHEIALRN